MENALIPLEELKTMAAYVCKSNLFAMPNNESTLALMLMAQAEGVHPMMAMRKYHIIKGRPSMKAEAMMAEFQARGGKVQWLSRTDEECSAKFSHPSGGELTVAWNMERAKKAELLGNPTWKKFPCQMLSARCISEGVRAVLPAVVSGLYTPEEVSDFDGKDQDVLPVEPVKETVVKTIRPIAEKRELKPAAPAEEPVEAETVEAVPVEQAHMQEKKAPKAEEPKRTLTGAEMADKIRLARAKAVEFGCRSVEDLESFTEACLGRKSGTLASLSPEELDKMINFKEGAC